MVGFVLNLHCSCTIPPYQDSLVALTSCFSSMSCRYLWHCHTSAPPNFKAFWWPMDGESYTGFNMDMYQTWYNPIMWRYCSYGPCIMWGPVGSPFIGATTARLPRRSIAQLVVAELMSIVSHVYIKVPRFRAHFTVGERKIVVLSTDV